MTTIFISYRRNDCAAVAGRVQDRLCNVFGAANVFLDIDGVPLGADFRLRIRNAVRSSSFVLVLIGQDWASGSNDWYERFLKGEDWVRIEIETAIEFEVPIIPVLIDGARMLPAEYLPESIREIAHLNALMLSSGADFNDQLARLVRSVSGVLPRVVNAFTDHVEHKEKDSGSFVSTRNAIGALRGLYESLVDCHEAYLRYAQDLSDISLRERRKTILTQRPHYAAAVRNLAQVVWSNRATLEIFAPDVLEALVGYVDTETGFLGDESAISRISNSLITNSLRARQNWDPFEEARRLLAEFIRANANLKSFLQCENSDA